MPGWAGEKLVLGRERCHEPKNDFLASMCPKSDPDTYLLQGRITLRLRRLVVRAKAGYCSGVGPLRRDDVPNVDSFLFLP